MTSYRIMTRAKALANAIALLDDLDERSNSADYVQAQAARADAWTRIAAELGPDQVIKTQIRPARPDETP